MNFLFGRKPQNRQVSLQTEGQQDLLNQLIQQIMGGQGGFGFDEDFFQRSFADPALRQFETQTAPSIQQRFIGAGAGRGSNVQDVLARAGADVQGGIDQKRAELLNQALDRQLRGAQTALGTRAFGIEQDPGEQGFFQSVIAPAAGAAFGGPVGAALGQGAAGLIRRGFRR